MEITDVRIIDPELIAAREGATPRETPNDGPSSRLLAYCSVVFDNSLVVHDIKIINGSRGLMITMPSRKLVDSCPRCRARNHLRSRYCNWCGLKHDPDRTRPNQTAEEEGKRVQYYIDTTHPISSSFRAVIEQAVYAAYEEHLVKKAQSMPVGRDVSLAPASTTLPSERGASTSFPESTSESSVSAS